MNKEKHSMDELRDVMGSSKNLFSYQLKCLLWATYQYTTTVIMEQSWQPSRGHWSSCNIIWINNEWPVRWRTGRENHSSRAAPQIWILADQNQMHQGTNANCLSKHKCLCHLNLVIQQYHCLHPELFSSGRAN